MPANRHHHQLSTINNFVTSDIRPPASSSHHSARQPVALPPARTAATIIRPASLGALFQFATQVVEFSHRQHNIALPILFLTCPEGEHAVSAGDFIRLGMTHGYEHAAQIICTAWRAAACAIALPLVTTLSGQRVEVVLFYGQDKRGRRLRLRPVKRDHQRAYRGLGRAIPADPGSRSTGLRPLLSSKPDSEEERHQARQTLAAQRVKPEHFVPVRKEAPSPPSFPPANSLPPASPLANVRLVQSKHNDQKPI